MSKVIADITMSLDGYVAPPPSPHGASSVDELQAWVMDQDPVDTEILERATAATGAVVMGRRLFDIVDAPDVWTKDMAYGAQPVGTTPIFVVSHSAPSDVRLERELGLRVTFVNGLTKAIDHARSRGDRGSRGDHGRRRRHRPGDRARSRGRAAPAPRTHAPGRRNAAVQDRHCADVPPTCDSPVQQSGPSDLRKNDVMGDYIEIDGHQTWVETFGSATADETVVLLHGGISNSDDLRATAAVFEDRYRLIAFDRRGHGRTADTDRPFSYVEMASETIGVLEHVVGGSAALVGWSDGGIVALLVALRRPDLVRRMVLIGVDFHFTGVRPFGQDPAMEATFEAMKAMYVERSPDGADHFPVMLAKATELMASEPQLTTDDIATVSTPTLVLVGDDDLIELAHTVALYEALPAGRLAVIPAASHMVPVEQPEVVGRLIADFLAAPDPPQTMMPSRRA